MALQIRRGLEADRLSITPLEGELIYVTDTGNIYVGDGTTAGGGLVSGEVSNDGSPQLGGDLDLNGNDIIGNGNINIDGIITATGNINLGDEASDNISVLGSLTTSIIPKLDANVDVGSNSNRWRNGYFTGLEVNGQIDAESINGDLIADDSTVVFNASTGKILASAVEGTFNIDSVTGDLIGSVFADNSTLLVDGVNAVIPGEVISGTITSNLVGVVTGSLTGDVKC